MDYVGDEQELVDNQASANAKVNREFDAMGALISGEGQMGTNPVVPQLENTEWNNIGQSETDEQVASKKLWPDAKNDAGEYESKFLATSQLLQAEIEKTARLEKQMALARVELVQYGNDLRMWVSAHASEYPARRARELQAKMNEIEAVK